MEQDIAAAWLLSCVQWHLLTEIEIQELTLHSEHKWLSASGFENLPAVNRKIPPSVFAPEKKQ